VGDAAAVEGFAAVWAGSTNTGGVLDVDPGDAVAAESTADPAEESSGANGTVDPDPPCDDPIEPPDDACEAAVAVAGPVIVIRFAAGTTLAVEIDETGITQSAFAVATEPPTPPPLARPTAGFAARTWTLGAYEIGWSLPDV